MEFFRNFIGVKKKKKTMDSLNMKGIYLELLDMDEPTS